MPGERPWLALCPGHCGNCGRAFPADALRPGGALRPGSAYCGEETTRAGGLWLRCSWKARWPVGFDSFCCNHALRTLPLAMAACCGVMFCAAACARACAASCAAIRVAIRAAFCAAVLDCCGRALLKRLSWAGVRCGPACGWAGVRCGPACAVGRRAAGPACGWAGVRCGALCGWAGVRCGAPCRWAGDQATRCGATRGDAPKGWAAADVGAMFTNP